MPEKEWKRKVEVKRLIRKFLEIEVKGKKDKEKGQKED